MEDLIMKIIDIEDRAQEVIKDAKKADRELEERIRTNLVKCVMTLREEWRLKTSL